MTIWGVAGVWLGFLAYAVAWLRGGRAERFAAGVLILHCMAATIVFEREVEGFHLARIILDDVRLLIFGWLCFRSDRWWPFITTAALGLIALLHVATLLDPALYFASASAGVGLGYLIDVMLLVGVGERVLAGEAPAGRAAWARSHIETAAPRRRGCPPRRSSKGLWIERPEALRDHRPRLPA